MHQSLQGATFHLEHIIPRSKGGSLEVSNLALACPSCNLHKADQTMAIDPETGASVSLFHPVRQALSDHFRFSGHRIEGSTPIGRATVAVLDLNHLRRQRIRAVEQRFGLYPPIR
jgi:HNH endonuclease